MIKQAIQLYYAGPTSSGKYMLVDQDGYSVATGLRRSDALWIIQAHKNSFNHSFDAAK